MSLFPFQVVDTYVSISAARRGEGGAVER
jgi:hypothetical protein